MPEDALERIIDLALEEDVGPGDWTTLWTVEPQAHGRAVVVAKEALVVAGTGPAVRVFERVDPRLEVSVISPDGTLVAEDEVVISLEGSLRGILTGERTALNFLGRLCGIATLTRRFADAVAGTGAEILDTRKTTPGWRMLEKEAVRAGGGKNHRLGLHDMVLVKDNHLVAAGGVTAAVERVRRGNREGIPVEVEVGTLEELDELLPLGVDRILLDNMSTEVMAECVRRVRALGPHGPEVEASGNMTLQSVGEVAETGVDFISIGALTHSAATSDLSLKVLAK
ncbi:carboxylating nicotinate-nucleotide diphosphorylase [Gemmatimonadota bacterium]